MIFNSKQKGRLKRNTIIDLKGTLSQYIFQKKMGGQRGRLPVQALGYGNSTKVILGLPETAGGHFLLRPHHYILKVITQFRNGGPRANTSMEASFTGILERNSISGWINQRGIYIFTT